MHFVKSFECALKAPGIKISLFLKGLRNLKDNLKPLVYLWI